MKLVAVGYVKAGTGATTAAVGLGATLLSTGQPVVVIECDPAGGDLVVRHGLQTWPGLVELASAAGAEAATRPGSDLLGTVRPGSYRTTALNPATPHPTTSVLDGVLSGGVLRRDPRAGPFGSLRPDGAMARTDGWRWLTQFAQPLRLGDVRLPVVAAPPGAAQTRVALSVLAEEVDWLQQAGDTIVVADCGRLDYASPAWPLLTIADPTVILTRPRPDDLAHLRDHLARLVHGVGTRLLVLLVAGGPYSATEVEAMLRKQLDAIQRETRPQVRQQGWRPHVYGAETPLADRVAVRGPLPYDAVTAAVLEGTRPADRRWRRRPLAGALSRLAVEAGLVPEAPGTMTDPGGPRGTQMDTRVAADGSHETSSSGGASTAARSEGEGEATP